MDGFPYFIVDVFAEHKYSGNQLAVILDAEGLDGVQMQQIAQEMHFSETTFLINREVRDGGYDVRIFTSKREVPFAGHPTLGTAFVINQNMEGGQANRITLNLPVGLIPVDFDFDPAVNDVPCLWMTQAPPVFGGELTTTEVAPTINLSEENIDSRYPIQIVSTGLPFIIIPVTSLKALRQAHVDREKYFALVDNLEAQALFLFCPETYNPENQLSVRMFADAFGIFEDPATGSGCGCLAAYLVKYRYFGEDAIDVRVEQGMEIHRPSLLFLRSSNESGDITVRVGGHVVMVAKGTLL
jgi:trans-2,3-dihydro-3-hydroxyanthranilate isomerase